MQKVDDEETRLKAAAWTHLQPLPILEEIAIITKILSGKTSDWTVVLANEIHCKFRPSVSPSRYGTTDYDTTTSRRNRYDTDSYNTTRSSRYGNDSETPSYTSR